MVNVTIPHLKCFAQAQQRRFLGVWRRCLRFCLLKIWLTAQWVGGLIFPPSAFYICYFLQASYSHIPVNKLCVASKRGIRAPKAGPLRQG
jgi:hypothetical protein